MPSQGLLAGDGYSCSITRLLLLSVVEEMATHHPRAAIRQYVDDLRLILVSEHGQPLAFPTARASLSLLARLRALRCVIDASSVVVATTPAMRRSILAICGNDAALTRAVQHARDLGADYSLGVVRRVGTFRSRMRTSQQRAATLSRWSRTAAESTRLAATATQASIVWGAATQGLAPSTRSRARAALVKSAGLAKGACPHSVVRTVFSPGDDPDAKVIVKAVSAFFSLRVTAPVWSRYIGACWPRLLAHLFEQPTRWNRVKGPMGGPCRTSPRRWVAPGFLGGLDRPAWQALGRFPSR